MKNRFYSFIKIPSISVIILICLTIIQIHLNLARWNNKSVITWDILGYYSYLPALFIDKDIKLSFINETNYNVYNGSKYVSIKDANGHYVMKFPMGMAIMYAPFFAIAHALATPLGYANDGYSEIYQCCIEFSGLFYLLFGLIFLRKTLLLFYSEKMTALSLLFIFFGTNLLCYASIDSAMSHAYTFSLFSIFIYYLLLFYKSPQYKFVIYLGILFGLIVLIRPINLMFIVVALFIGITTFQLFKERLQFFITHYKLIGVFVLTTFLIISPQLMYWKYVTGHFFYFSYGEEHFYFNNPHIIQCLVGFKKGWFIYTPLILFSLLGVWFMKKQGNTIFYTAIIILLPIYLFIISCWWCWWYGGSYSQRTLIDIYPLLCISFASFFQYVSRQTKLTKQIIFSVMIVLLFLNLFQTTQYKYNIIHYDAMTFREYVHVFGTLDSKNINEALLNHPDYEKAIMGLND